MAHAQFATFRPKLSHQTARQAGQLRVPLYLHLAIAFVFLCSGIGAISPSIDPESNFLPHSDVMVLRNFGAAAERCGNVALEYPELHFALLMRINTDQLTKKPRNCSANRYVTARLLGELEKIDETLALPSWLAASLKSPSGDLWNWMDAANRHRASVRTVSSAGIDADDYTVFDSLSSVFGIINDVMNDPNADDYVGTLRAQEAALNERLEQLEDDELPLSPAHFDMARVERDGAVVYEYSSQQLSDLARAAESLSCPLATASDTLTATAHRFRLVNKLYADINAALTSLLTNKLTPILLPLRNMEALLTQNEHLLHDTIYFSNKQLMYQFSSVHAVWPVRMNSIGFILRVRNIKDPKLTPLYCVRNVGLLDQNSIARRYSLPAHLITAPQERSCSRGDTNRSCPSEMLEPILKQCQNAAKSVYVCRVGRDLKAAACFDNSSKCQVEAKLHGASEWLPGVSGYAVRTSGQCRVKVTYNSELNLRSHEGFQYVPLDQHGTLLCDPDVALPLQRIETRVINSDSTPLFTPNLTSFRTVLTAEWRNVDTLKITVVPEVVSTTPTVVAVRNYEFTNQLELLFLGICAFLAFSSLIACGVFAMVLSRKIKELSQRTRVCALQCAPSRLMTPRKSPAYRGLPAHCIANARDFHTISPPEPQVYEEIGTILAQQLANAQNSNALHSCGSLNRSSKYVSGPNVSSFAPVRACASCNAERGFGSEIDPR